MLFELGSDQSGLAREVYAKSIGQPSRTSPLLPHSLQEGFYLRLVHLIWMAFTMEKMNRRSHCK